VAQIDTPQLGKLVITFFHQLIFDTPRLTQFIGRTPRLKGFDEAHVFFSDRVVSVTFPQAFSRRLQLGILCSQSDWQLSSLAQVCSSSFPQALIPTVERLCILEDDGRSRLRWQDDIESSQWVELLHLFTAVKGLYISREFMPRVVPALHELVEERVTEVLPAMQTLFIETTSAPVQSTITRFAAARELSNCPIAISYWEGKRLV
jgi:hypothetical protein